MTLPRTAAAYAVLAEHEIEMSAQPGNPDPHWHLMRAQSFASLSAAAATLEAARLTLDAQASSLLSALEEPEPGVCIGCGCVANIDRGGVLVCEEYPGCSALMESPK